MGASSDHASFWNAGFKAIFPFEDSEDYSPYIHTSNDVLGTSVNSLELAQLGTQALVASMAGLAEIAETKICGYVKSAETLGALAGINVTVDATTYSTDENGFFTTEELVPGEYDITISDDEYDDVSSSINIGLHQTIQKTFFLMPAGIIRPFVHLVGKEIDDDNIGDSTGDDDGISDSGEIIELFLEFSNFGNVNADNMETVISLAEPTDAQWISISNSSSSISSLPVNDTLQTSTPFVFSISEETPDNTSISFNVHLEYNSYSSDQNFTIFISKLGDILIVEDDNNDGGLGDFTRA
ncbi:MAG: hypothetical protein KAR38_13520, partial [Calditrichia bacterium]|nr:hypothetical protein [Calditrichia bacterium]